MKTKILLLGTCRLYRPFLKKDNRVLYDNRNENIEVVYPKLGFFHSINEICQLVKLVLKKLVVNDVSYQKYIFRHENVVTTPGNEFNSEVSFSIKNNLKFSLDARLLDVDVILIEISSLDYFFHPDSNLVFHMNPNFENSVAYSEIYPEGYYTKFMPELGVVKCTSSLDEVIAQMQEIKLLLTGMPVIVLGHLYDPIQPNKIRHKLCNLLSEACKRVGFNFFDTSKFVADYGFKIGEDGKVDIHHLSHDGEMALGKELQIYVDTIR